MRCVPIKRVLFLQPFFLVVVLLGFGCAMACTGGQTTTPRPADRNAEASGDPGSEKKESIAKDTATKREAPSEGTEPNPKGCVQGDCENGSGVFVYPDGDRYTGPFRNGVREGEGVMEYANGDRYEGGFSGDQRQGQGTYTFKDKDVFVGQFNRGNREGQGTYRFESGEIFVGQLKEDGNSGEGRLKRGDQELSCSLKGRAIFCESAAQTVTEP